jgi:hypothetical protein
MEDLEMNAFRKHPRIFGLVSAVVVGLALVAAPRARAGDQEWAVVGKILTGVVAAHILFGEPEIRATRTVVVHREPVRMVYAPRRCPPRVVVPPRYHHDRGRPYGHMKEEKGRHCRSHQRYERCDRPYGGAVIRQLSRTRRIYQPRVRGHVAFIQVRSHHGHEWATVGECRSIW